VLPVVIQGDRHVVVGHVEQLREFLGMPPGIHAEWSVLVAATNKVLKAFEALLTKLPDERITDPTPNRGRDMRDMTVNVFSLMECLIDAMNNNHFSYMKHKEMDATSPRFKKTSELIEYAGEIRERWLARAMKVSREEVDRLVTTDRKGDQTQYLALDSGGRHAAGHLRQAYQFMRQIGIDPGPDLTAEDIAPIQVQTSLY
jgi:hypothetical protein